MSSHSQRQVAPVARPLDAAILTTILGFGGAAMTLSRRDAIGLSTSTLLGVSLGVISRETLKAQTSAPQAPWPDQLVERPLRDGFPAPLPLNADGSAPEHPPSAAGPITDPL